ncbi:hypothetical protein G7Y89_g11170 [Cudoniella acicularis]|uniref:Alcohol dehydrogenase-like C-terminal domain-containing protein n=1 Tax=Cudoniella acicularis TaxID=354080 RepID=A0A8H4W0C7_9HELO|nr:hypothetical protein G7Y89_g11170 [Cudoniella acicularis]
MYQWLRYPSILGFDVAAEVVEPDLTSHISSTMPYEQAAVIPLGLATGAAAPLRKGQLALDVPTASSKRKGKTVLAWGGSTSVGCNAIQLAAAGGYEVITTCSPSNYALAKSLGATQVFSYDNVPGIIKAFEGKTSAGAISIGPSGAEACMSILSQTKSAKVVSLVAFPSPAKEPESLVMLRTAYFFISWMATYKLKGLFKGVGKWELQSRSGDLGYWEGIGEYSGGFRDSEERRFGEEGRC